MYTDGSSVLLDCKVSSPAISADGLVHPSIRSTADEADDFVLLVNPYFATVARHRHLLRVGWL